MDIYDSFANRRETVVLVRGKLPPKITDDALQYVATSLTHYDVGKVRLLLVQGVTTLEDEYIFICMLVNLENGEGRLKFQYHPNALHELEWETEPEKKTA